jgi:CubicO group peptidase (beta-lactamase class C family)
MPTPTAGPTIPSAVKEHIRELVDNEYSRGIVVALIDASGTTYYSYGKMSRDGAPVNERTIFEIGSVSKVFTAILLADLVERGVVTLDTPIEKYLPPEVRVPERNAKKITLEHLATHRSGLPRMPTNWKPKDPNNPYVDYTTKDLQKFPDS